MTVRLNTSSKAARQKIQAETRPAWPAEGDPYYNGDDAADGGNGYEPETEKHSTRSTISDTPTIDWTTVDAKVARLKFVFEVCAVCARMERSWAG